MHKSNALLNVHFADDTTGLCKGKNLNEMVPFVNQVLQKLVFGCILINLLLMQAKQKS